MFTVIVLEKVKKTTTKYKNQLKHVYCSRLKIKKENRQCKKKSQQKI